MEDIMRRADQALYMSKTQGGHRASDSSSLGGLGRPEHEHEHEREDAPGR